MSVCALIPAAGSGARMGSSLPKVLLDLGGQSVLARVVRLFSSCPDVQRVVVLHPAGYHSHFLDALGPQFAEALEEGALVLLEGGATRQESVSIGVAWCTEQLAPNDEWIVAVHDAARPLLSAELLQRTIEAAAAHAAATAAIPIADTLVREDQGQSLGEALSRAGVWAVQTPQVFALPLLAEAHQRATGEYTDDATLVQKLRSVALVQGERMNFKLTTPDDYALAKRII